MNWLNRCHFGDVSVTMRAMIAEGVKVRTIVTSPPYWGVRSYLPDAHPDKHLEIGQEPTLHEFIDKLVGVFDLCRDLLADDGTLWLNIGDAYAGSWGAQGRPQGQGQMAGRSVTSARQIAAVARFQTCTGMRGKEERLKPKDLMGQPWRLAFALQDAGWYLRQDIIWSKPNPMPESVADRCTKAHEYLFLLSKNEHYYCDMDAIKEPAAYGPTPSGVGFGHGFDSVERVEQRGRIRLPGNVNPAKGQAAYEAGDEQHRTKGGLQKYAEKVRDSVKRGDFNGKTNELEGREAFRAITESRNKRSVWTIPTKPYKSAHFATFPEKLVEPCVLAGSRPGDIVFDPFFGSGTTGQVAQRLGRGFLGCELNRDNDQMQRDRLQQPGLELFTASPQ